MERKTDNIKVENNRKKKVKKRWKHNITRKNNRKQRPFWIKYFIYYKSKLNYKLKAD